MGAILTLTNPQTGQRITANLPAVNIVDLNKSIGDVLDGVKHYFSVGPIDCRGDTAYFSANLLRNSLVEVSPGGPNENPSQA